METRKVVINTCWGGFGLSDKARTALGAGYEFDWEIARDDPKLVEVVEKLGAEANRRHAHLKVVEIPKDVVWFIHDYDGKEHVAEQHRTWL